MIMNGPGSAEVFSSKLPTSRANGAKVLFSESSRDQPLTGGAESGPSSTQGSGPSSTQGSGPSSSRGAYRAPNRFWLTEENQPRPRRQTTFEARPFEGPRPNYEYRDYSAGQGESLISRKRAINILASNGGLERARVINRESTRLKLYFPGEHTRVVAGAEFTHEDHNAICSVLFSASERFASDIAEVHLKEQDGTKRFIGHRYTGAASNRLVRSLEDAIKNR